MPHTRGGIGAERITPKFEMERDEFHARQLCDDGTTEAERRRAFKVMRRERSGSDMVRRDRLNPALRPSPELASRSDRVSYNDRLSAERAKARREEWISKALEVRDELRSFRHSLGDTGQTLKAADAQYEAGDKGGARREMFKIERSVKSRASRTHSHSRALMSDIPNR
ncbi:MAG: hypothetical protein AAF234_13750 [Pseudomonadota bacterium]